MFGLKGDWSLDVKERYFTLEDYCGAEPRWCTGCGDHGILAAVHRVCRDAQLKPEKTVAVSGIGCSSRLPHYMNTYGFHGLHGRALPVACGIKSRRPDLDVWVATGDGDCFSIGAAHWIHAMRYNMDLTMLVFDNGIYGLTKKQTSPTTPLDVPTNTHPSGALLPPMNPLTVTLGITNISFVAQIVDWNAQLRHEVIRKAHEHKGTSFVRIIQRCPVYVEAIGKTLQDEPARLKLLTHEKGVQVDDSVKRQFPNHAEHDPSDINAARELAENPEELPLGILYQNPDAPRYDLMTAAGLEMTAAERLAGLVDDRRDAGLGRFPSQAAIRSGPVDDNAQTEVNREIANRGIGQVRAYLRQVRALERACVQINQSVAIRDDVGEEGMSDSCCGAAGRIAREVAIQIAAVRQVTRAAPKTLHIDDRNADNRAGQLARIHVVKDTTNHLHAIKFVAVDGSGKAQRRAGQTAVDDEHRRGNRHTFEKLGC